VEEARVPGENHRAAAGHRQTLSHNVVSSTPQHEVLNAAFNNIPGIINILWGDMSLH